MNYAINMKQTYLITILKIHLVFDFYHQSWQHFLSGKQLN